MDAILRFLKDPTGNASSLHSFGQMAKSAVKTARQQVAELLGCRSKSVIFTSGGTEANSVLLKGWSDPQSLRPRVSSEIEHPSILEPLAQIKAESRAMVLLKSNNDGQIDINHARQQLAIPDAQLLSITPANNETDVLQPVEALASMIDRERCLFHSDATQVVGKLPLDMNKLNGDALSFSGHKLQGPQGIGALR